MTYYYARRVDLSFDEAITAATEALKRHGFGLLSDIDVQKALKEKIGKDVPRYRILGACNPVMADRAIAAEPMIGTMLPCNVVVREDAEGRVEIAAVDPVASMQAVHNPGLGPIAGEVRVMLRKAVDEVSGPATDAGPRDPGPTS